MMTVDEKERERVQPVFRKQYRRVGILILVPLLLSFLLHIHKSFSYTSNERERYIFAAGWIYVSFLVGIFWITYVVPMAAAGFIVFILLPLLGTTASGKLASEFMSNSNATTFAGIAIMMAYDNSGLRRRLTLRILQHSRCAPRRLYLYVFIVTSLIAMWFGCAGATYLMMRTVDDILETLKEEVGHGALGDERMLELQSIHNVNEAELASQDGESKETDDPSLDTKTNPEEIKDESFDVIPENSTMSSPDKVELLKVFEGKNEQLLQNFGGVLLYAIAVAANIGGALWPHGWTVGMEMFKRAYTHGKDPQTKETVYRWTQASWMIYSFPFVLMNSLIAMLLLVWVNFSRSSVARAIVGVKGQRLWDYPYAELSQEKLAKIFSSKRRQLGPWCFQERTILVLTVLLVLAVLTKAPLFILGWSDMLPYRNRSTFDPKTNKTTVAHIETGDSVPYVFVTLLLFLIPKAGHKICSGPTSFEDKPQRDGLHGWKPLQSKFPWAIPVLVGASRTLGKFSQYTVAYHVANRMGVDLPRLNPSSIMMLKLILMGEIMLCSIFISNTGAAITVLQIWAKFIVIHETWDKTAGLVIGGDDILPAFWVAALSFIIPTSSVPTAMVYIYQEKKNLSIWYFVRVGIPLTLCTVTVTVGYALLWSSDS